MKLSNAVLRSVRDLGPNVSIVVLYSDVACLTGRDKWWKRLSVTAFHEAIDHLERAGELVTHFEAGGIERGFRKRRLVSLADHRQREN